ncbi:MAG: gamma-glutamyltransferase, partial [Ghiorsea sp.]|nr:gamma-glutamyltransferase [Ghiorsea sp.]
MKKLVFLCVFVLFPWLTEAQPLTQSMVVSAHPLATNAGIQVLRQGGNAFDAAAATALALGVVEPGSSGIGGGGFFLLYIAKEDRYVMLDARETSPVLAGQGEVYAKQSSINGAQSAGVPGLLAGIEHLHQHYGRLSRDSLVQPAIRLARDGFPITKHLQQMITWRAKALNDAARRIYFNQGHIPVEGWLLKQQALADTLQKFAKYGADDFYRGETAGRLVADMKHSGGLIRAADLARYQVKERVPVAFHYQGYHFISAALPSSGGITLAEIFGMLKGDDLSQFNKVQRTHLLAEVMKRAYNDRNPYWGDSDFVHIPNLLNEKRLKSLRASIDMTQATPSSQLKGFSEPIGGSVDTTHFSIVDHEGNMVSATLSINYGMGSGYVSPSTGILLNDEMDDFATQAGKPNAYGLIQGKANAVAPHKRMLSSMSPTFVIGKARNL